MSSVSHAATFELGKASIPEIQAAIDAGALSAEKLTQLCLARIAAYDQAGPKINAIITVNSRALEEARSLDAERRGKGRRSQLHGIPVILKDNFNTTDLPTTAGCVFLAGSVPSTDAFVTARLRAAGAIILAKANTSEFALSGKSNGFSSLGGQTLNPHDLTRGPAGSSGGSGAALAAWFAPIAFGTDTGGSVRGPCSANGVAGLKPSLGMLSRAGIVPLALSFDTGGPMAGNVYDVAAALSVTAGVDPDDPATVGAPGAFPKLMDAYLAEPAGRPGRANPARWDVFREEAANGRTLDDPEYIAARDHGLALVRDTLAAILRKQKLDAFIYPTSPLPARPIKRDYSEPPPESATSLANAAGLPDVIVPAGATSANLPVTLSFLGPAFSEAQLFGYAFAFEQATHARITPAATPALPGETFTY